MLDTLTKEVRLLGNKVGVVEAMLPHIMKSNEKQTEILEKIAVQQEKATAHEHRLDQLSSEQRDLLSKINANQLETKTNTVRVAFIVSIVMTIVGFALKSSVG